MSIALSPSKRRVAATAIVMLAICAVFNMVGRGAVDSFAVFLLPLEQAFGVGRTTVSGIYSFAFLLMGLSGPAVGFLFDRFGAAVTFAVGILLGVAGMWIASHASAVWQLYVALGLLLGGSAACIGNVTNASIIRRWYRRRLNTALAVAYAAASLGPVIWAPMAQSYIDALGWRGAYLRLSLITLLLVVPLILFLLLKGERGAPPEDGEPGKGARPPDVIAGAAPGLGDALRGSAFWGLAWIFTCTGIGMYTVLLQIPAMLVEVGYDAAISARIFALCGLLALFGMIAFGWLGDRFRRRNVVLVSYGWTLTGVSLLLLLLFENSPIVLAGFVFFFGGSFGARGPAISAIAAQLFAGPRFASIYGSLTIFMGLGAALGSWFGGLWREVSGDYRLGAAFALVALILGALPFLVVPRIARS